MVQQNASKTILLDYKNASSTSFFVFHSSFRARKKIKLHKMKNEKKNPVDMANLEVFRSSISSSINFLFLKNDGAA
jgi:hypothetical protein